MKVSREITVGVSADRAWELIGEKYGSVGDFTSILHSSHLEGKLEVGVTRVCNLGKKGNAVETLTQFDRQARVLTYVATKGLPPFMKRAQNHWEVIEKDPNSALLRTSPTVDIKWWGWPMVPLMKIGIGLMLNTLLEEAKHMLETGELHPRVKKQKTKIANLLVSHS